VALPAEIRHELNSKTPPTRIATDRRGRNREEAGYEQGRRPGRKDWLPCGKVLNRQRISYFVIFECQESRAKFFSDFQPGCRKRIRPARTRNPKTLVFLGLGTVNRHKRGRAAVWAGTSRGAVWAVTPVDPAARRRFWLDGPRATRRGCRIIAWSYGDHIPCRRRWC
jgi:hypothetical protein